MDKLLIKSLVVAAVGGITLKAIKAARLYSQQVKEHKEIMDNSEED